MSLRLRFAAQSHVGLLREGNEDSGYAGARLLAIADGMGGAAAGEVASSETIAALAPLDEDVSGADLIDALRRAVDAANDRIHAIVEKQPHLEGMGTTLTALLWSGQRLALAHVGDSRGYLLRDGALTQITRDHTFVQSLVDEGRISADEATSHPQRSLITRAIDGRADVELDASIREVAAGDRYLLCSDGLSGVVSADTIAEALAGGSPDEAAGRLIDLALRGGGPDNVTCVVADLVDDTDTAPEVGPVVAGAAAEQSGHENLPDDSAAGRAALASPRPDPEPEDEPEPEQRHRRRGPVLLGAGLVIVLLAAAAGGAWWWSRSQYYIGTAPLAGVDRVAVYRGVSGKFAGLDLSTVDDNSRLPVSALPPYQRHRVREGISADGRAGAHRIVGHLRREVCTTPTPQPAASPSASAHASASPGATKSPRAAGTGKPAASPSAGAHTPSPSPSAAPSARPSPTPTPTPVPGCGQGAAAHQGTTR
jgi:protein phosphatase